MRYRKRTIIIFIISLVWLVLFFIINLPFLNSDEFSNSTIHLSVNIAEPIAMVNISPNDIYFGEITKGYETAPKNITVTNIGTIDVKITPVLDNGADELFNNLKFASASCSSWYNASRWNSSIISHSANYSNRNGEVYPLCIKLDLTNYESEIIQNKTLSANLTFWVMPA